MRIIQMLISTNKFVTAIINTIAVSLCSISVYSQTVSQHYRTTNMDVFSSGGVGLGQYTKTSGAIPWYDCIRTNSTHYIVFGLSGGGFLRDTDTGTMGIFGPNNHEKTDVPFQVFPNPAQSHVTIRVATQDELPIHVQMISNTGVSVYNKFLLNLPLGSIDIQINLEECQINSGYYHVIIRHRDQVAYKKLIVLVRR